MSMTTPFEKASFRGFAVVEAYRLDEYDNNHFIRAYERNICCRSLSFGQV